MIVLRRTASALVLTLLGAVCATGWQSTSTAQSISAPLSPTSLSTSATSALIPEDINPQPASALAHGGQVVWSLDQYSTQWNVNEVDGAEASTVNVIGAVLPLPMVSNDRGIVRADHDYLTSIKQSPNDPKTIKGTLNPAAKWSDGTPITEADYAASLTACDGHHRGFQCAATTPQVESVKQGSAGKFSFVLTLNRRFADWRSLFNTYLYPKQFDASAHAFNTGYLNKIPLTAGPFGDPTLDKSSQTVTVTRNPNWWGRTPRLSTIVFKALTFAAANRAFAHGRVDYDFDVAVDRPDYQAIDHSKHGHVTLAAGTDYRQLTVSSVHDPLHFTADVKVRRAVELAINRDMLIRSDLHGIPWPTVPLDNHFFMNVQTGYRNDMGGLASYDPHRANQLLKQDGFRKDSNGFYAKDGHEIDLDFMIPDGITTSLHEGELTQAMLRDAGIKVHINAVPINYWANKYLVPGRFDLAPFSWLATSFPISSSRSIYSSPHHGGAQNFTGTANPAVDALMRKASRASSSTTAATVVNRADRLLYKEVHTITLFERPQMCGVSNGLANLGSFGFAGIDYTKIGWMKKQ